MKIGVVYPVTELGGDPESARAFARGVAEMGYEHISAYDHVVVGPHDGRDPPLRGGGYTEAHSFHDPFVLFGHLSALVPLELATAVLVLSQRQATLVAEQAAELDLLSDGRLRLGVGTGWNYLEYQALGSEFASRRRRLDEQVEVLRRLWSGGLVNFEGEFQKLDRIALVPPPRRQIPIWFGGRSEAAYRRAARVGDGFMFVGDIERATSARARIHAEMLDVGREPGAFGCDLIVHPAAPEKARETCLRWRDAGGTHVTLSTLNGTSAHSRRTSSTWRR